MKYLKLVTSSAIVSLVSVTLWSAAMAQPNAQSMALFLGNFW